MIAIELLTCYMFLAVIHPVLMCHTPLLVILPISNIGPFQFRNLSGFQEPFELWNNLRRLDTVAKTGCQFFELLCKGHCLTNVITHIAHLLLLLLQVLDLVIDHLVEYGSRWSIRLLWKRTL